MQDLERILIGPDATLREAMAAIGHGAVGIVLVVDQERRLLGTVTDGDIRRAILDNVPLDEKVNVLLACRPADYETPTVAPVGTPRSKLLALMSRKSLRQIPLLDKAGRIVDLALLEATPDPITAVVMAGGFGRRLHPLTNDVPKPMLPLKGRPLMERIIEQLCKADIQQVYITTHYKPEVITNHFGDGRAFGVNIEYVSEDRPLGTAGALGLMEAPQSQVLVVNGDILTQLDFRALYTFHREYQAQITVGVRKYDFQIPYGVVETEGVGIMRLVEKPTQTVLVNAGVYLLEPEACQYIPRNSQYDMTDLIQTLIDAGRRVISFPICEYWMDIGNPQDYERANRDIRNPVFDKNRVSRRAEG